MPRVKSPKADNLTNAMATLSTAVDDLVKATNRLNDAFDKKDLKVTTAALAEVHLAVLHAKDSSNFVYPHLAELRPKTEPKPPRKDKKDRERYGLSVEEREAIPPKDKKDKVRPKRENHATVERDEPASDEPSDPDAP